MTKGDRCLWKTIFGTHKKIKVKIAKKMNGYGFRVQKSAFEAMISESLYRRLLQEIPAMIDSNNDSIRVYKIHGYGEVSLFGENIRLKNEEVIII